MGLHSLLQGYIYFTLQYKETEGSKNEKKGCDGKERRNESAQRKMKVMKEITLN
jgi:hypothetical protein